MLYTRGMRYILIFTLFTIFPLVGMQDEGISTKDSNTCSSEDLANHEELEEAIRDGAIEQVMRLLEEGCCITLANSENIFPADIALLRLRTTNLQNNDKARDRKKILVRILAYGGTILASEREVPLWVGPPFVRAMLYAEGSKEALSYLNDRDLDNNSLEDGLLIAIGRRYDDVVKKLFKEPCFRDRISSSILVDALEASGVVGNENAFRIVYSEMRRRIRNTAPSTFLIHAQHEGVERFVYWALINGHTHMIQHLLSHTIFTQRNIVLGHWFKLNSMHIAYRLETLSQNPRLSAKRQRNIKKGLSILEPYVKMQLIAKTFIDDIETSSSNEDETLKNFYIIINQLSAETLALILYFIASFKQQPDKRF